MKLYLDEEISPNSILVSGGQTTVANLFYNMSSGKVGLVGVWDVVAFDEAAGIKFKDKGGVQIMKDFMASGSFSREGVFPMPLTSLHMSSANPK
jgi:ATP-dependent Lon protease